MDVQGLEEVARRYESLRADFAPAEADLMERLSQIRSAIVHFAWAHPTWGYRLGSYSWATSRERIENVHVVDNGVAFTATSFSPFLAPIEVTLTYSQLCDLDAELMQAYAEAEQAQAEHERRMERMREEKIERWVADAKAKGLIPEDYVWTPAEVLNIAQ